MNKTKPIVGTQLPRFKCHKSYETTVTQNLSSPEMA